MASFDENSTERPGASFFLFLVWTFIIVARPQDYMSFLVPARPVLVMTILTLLAMFFDKTVSFRSLFGARELKLVLAFYLVMIASIPFAVNRGVAFRFAFIAMPSVLLYFSAAIIQVNSLKRLNRVMAVIAMSLLVSASFYAADALARRGFRVTVGQTYDPNDIAMLFATFIPAALYLLFGPYGIKMKMVSAAAVLLAAAGIMLSGSRGGFLAFAVILVTFLLSRAPRIRAFARIGIVALLALVFINYFAIVEGRFQNFGEDYNFSEENGRLNIWKQNLVLIAQNPVLGSGAGCSDVALGLYRAEVGGTQAWQVSHSSLLQFAVDNGIPAFIVFLVLNILAIANVRRIRRDRGHPLSNVAFFVELSFYGFWVGGLLLSHAYSINLFLLLGISAALRLLYENRHFRAAS